jgi:ABC-type dipeptide/oligopeptide/nickel transport system permease component
LLEALGAQYVLVAQARGATKLRLLWRYALPNAALPLLTAIGVGLGGLLGGAAIVEAIFTWPGIGSYVLEAISARDYPVVQGFVALIGLSYVTASLLVDLLALGLDPRLRTPRTA